MANGIRVICTTSNSYLHLIPVFTYLFNKYFGKEQEVTILGYEFPKRELPPNFKFHSMGVQGPVNEWSTDLRRYLNGIEDEWFIWLMEDTFIKAPVKMWMLDILKEYCDPKVGRIDLTRDMCRRPCRQAHFKSSFHDIVFAAMPDTDYRLSTQPSLWNRKYLLEYLTPGLTPWKFEVQMPSNDWLILGKSEATVIHNEGVRKHNPHELDLNGFPEEDVNFINSLLNDKV